MAARNGFVVGFLTRTNSTLLSLCLFLLRAAIGVILFMIGSGKVLGWFGGSGLPTALVHYADMGFSPVPAYMSCFTEFLGGAALIAGLLTRPAAFAVTINMAVATSVMMPKGFIFGGASAPFSLLVVAFVILLAGPMAFSLDALLLRPRQIIIK